MPKRKSSELYVLSPSIVSWERFTCDDSLRQAMRSVFYFEVVVNLSKNNFLILNSENFFAVLKTES